MMYHYGGLGPGAWIALAFVMVVFWGAVVTAIVFAVRGRHHRPTGSAAPTTSDVQRVLDHRFARGETGLRTDHGRRTGRTARYRTCQAQL
jgi:hypothetical protein